MKIAVFGASGIIGQHLRLCVPKDVEPVWARRHADLLHVGLDLNDFEAVSSFILREQPAAIINLAGENNTDAVERTPDKYRRVNVELPDYLSQLCRRSNIHYVHVSTQAVFDGSNPPYHPESPRQGRNEYGRQKLEAEQRIQWHSSSYWTIVRPTFVLGVRPMPLVGRTNPVEQMLSSAASKQVCDRFFSVAFAREVAVSLWNVATCRPQMRAVHVGVSPQRSRFTLAASLGCENVEAVSHDDFPGIAPRPVNTTYAASPDNPAREIAADMQLLRQEFFDRETVALRQRAKELSIFTGIHESDCLDKLSRGFGAMHGDVAADFRKFNPQNDAELLEWYRTTDAYLWELSAYHADAGFNYVGMCKGVAERLKAAGVKRVLCLGDGIGDLTLTLARHGFDAVYHDLYGSRTARFAQLRYWMYTGKLPETVCNSDWTPPELQSGIFDAICSFDFLEHVTDVPAWVSMIMRALKPGGLFFVQNAFACGSGPDGSIPMHLARNDHYEKDWDQMLAEIGLRQESSNWYVAEQEVMA